MEDEEYGREEFHNYVGYLNICIFRCFLSEVGGGVVKLTLLAV